MPALSPLLLFEYSKKQTPARTVEVWGCERSMK